jgi:hypothetical protein
MRPSRFLQLFAAIVYILFVATQGCIKDKRDTTKTTSSLDFTYTGTLWVYDTIRFQSNASSSSTFLWKFGDGSTSTDSTPSHVYKSINYTGTSTMLADTVTLVVNNDTAHAVVKVLKITPGASRLGGTWNWTGGFHMPNGLTVTGDTAHILADTTFSITVIDDSTISVWGETLPYSAVVSAYVNLWGYYGHMGSFVSYIHDTIFFANNFGGNGHWDNTSWHTP